MTPNGIAHRARLLVVVLLIFSFAMGMKLDRLLVRGVTRGSTDFWFNVAECALFLILSLIYVAIIWRDISRLAQSSD